MSVSRIDYLIWGVNLPFDSVNYDEYEKEIWQEDGRLFDMIYDGMSGKYAIAGKIIAKSDPYEGIDMVEIEPERLGFDKDAVRSSVNNSLGITGDFKLYLFSHFH